jgi:hypothetical protein
MATSRQRALSIVFFTAVIACAAAVALQRGRRKQEAAPPEPSVTSAPATLPPPKLATPPVPGDAGAHLADSPIDEHGLLLQIRATIESNPAQAEALARESRRRFPEGAEADERDALLVDTLINQQRIGRARDETYYYFDHHPHGRFADHLAAMTGVHPAPRRPGP